MKQAALFEAALQDLESFKRNVTSASAETGQDLSAPAQVAAALNLLGGNVQVITDN